VVAVDEDHYLIRQFEHRSYSVSALLESTHCAESWWVTVVYGPQGDLEKLDFLQELRLVGTVVNEKWLIIGDFNMILQASDKSNNNLNRRLLGAFRGLVNDLELRELNLRGRKFTWSNDTTQTRIDRAFCSREWDLMLPNSLLQAQSSMVSDHCPLLLIGAANVPKYTGFRFEAFWPKIDGFHGIVEETWNKPVHLHNPFLRLHTKLQRTSKRLKVWAKSKIGNVKLLLCAAKQLIGILDVVQEFRQLSVSEIQLRRDVKARMLGLAAVEKLRARQKSRLVHIRAEEANTKLFYLQAAARRRKNVIQHLSHNGRTLFTHAEKEKHIFYHFNTHFGQQNAREVTLDWDSINIQSHNLEHLEEAFTEEEVLAVVNDIAAEKAPGPDGYIGILFKSCWHLIKDDILAAVNYFYQQHDQHLKQLNNAHIILIPKKADPLCLGDFRPISLTNSIAKLISKILATRLAASLNQLVSRAQSAFIKRRSIQDNFLYPECDQRALQGEQAYSLFEIGHCQSF